MTTELRRNDWLWVQEFLNLTGDCRVIGSRRRVLKGRRRVARSQERTAFISRLFDFSFCSQFAGPKSSMIHLCLCLYARQKTRTGGSNWSESNISSRFNWMAKCIDSLDSLTYWHCATEWVTVDWGGNWGGLTDDRTNVQFTNNTGDYSRTCHGMSNYWKRIGPQHSEWTISDRSMRTRIQLMTHFHWRLYWHDRERGNR